MPQLSKKMNDRIQTLLERTQFTLDPASTSGFLGIDLVGILVRLTGSPASGSGRASLGALSPTPPAPHLTGSDVPR